ncbi:MAG: DNA-3-methyladenine glycosylase [Chloroflexi bacterium]|nr:DNA-3-methyladenine glycosylase [Chloroflexota bacterium]
MGRVSLRDPPSSGVRPEPLVRAVFSRPSHELARGLLGLWVARETDEGLTCGVIVETEAYGGPEDLASHARAGRTRRTAPMFGPAGHAYVYRIYGLHWCLNVVAERDGVAGAVLIRAVDPVLGLPRIRERRRRPGDPDERLAAGPARLCAALAIDGSLDGHDLTTGTALWIADADPAGRERLVAGGVVAGPRVGVSYAGDGWAERPWRFAIAGHPALSRRMPA